MTRWLFTAFSFAVAIGVSIYAVRQSAPGGVNLIIPWQAHVLAFLGFAIECASRSYKLVWSAKAVGATLSLRNALKVCLGGDLGASITPARSGAEPARYLILAKAGVSIPDAMVIMYTEVFFEMFSLIAVVGAMVLLFDSTTGARVAMTGIVGLYTAVIMTIGVIGYFLSKQNLTDVPPVWAQRLRITDTRWAFVRRWVDRVRSTAQAFSRMKYSWGAASLTASIVHVGIRMTILPAIIYQMTTAAVPLAPIVVWPFVFIYGAGVAPAPAGGGAVEYSFHRALGDAMPTETFAAALVWWRFYTFYLYIALGALVAGRMVLRAIREAEREVETELERP